MSDCETNNYQLSTINYQLTVSERKMSIFLSETVVGFFPCVI